MKRCGRDNEEIDRRQSANMVLEKRLPGWRWRLELPGHVLGHGRFGNVMAQQAKLGLDARSSPRHVLFSHAFDEGDDVAADRRPARHATRSRAPEKAEASLGPADNGLRLDNDEPRVPSCKELNKASPK